MTLRTAKLPSRTVARLDRSSSAPVGASVSPGVDSLLAALRATHGLSPAYLLRALSGGDVAVFVATLAALADEPAASVARLIRDRDTRALENLYARADLPPGLRPALHAALDVIFALRAERWRTWSAADSRRTVAALLRSYDALCAGAAPDGQWPKRAATAAAS